MKISIKLVFTAGRVVDNKSNPMAAQARFCFAHIWWGFSSFLVLFFVSLPLSLSAVGQQLECLPREVNARLGSLDDGELESLAYCGLPLVASLIPELQDKDYDRAYDAAQLIYLVSLKVGLDAEDAIPALLNILENHPESRLRAEAAYALQAIAPGDSETIKALVSAFQKDSDSYPKETILEAIASNSQGEPDTIDFLLSTIASAQNSSIRSSSVSALSKIIQRHQSDIDSKIVDDLISIIQQPNEEPEVIVYALQAIDNLNYVNDQIVDVIIQTLQLNTEEISSQAAITLAALSEQLYDQSNTLSEINQNQNIVRDIKTSLSTLRPSKDSDILAAQENIFRTLDDFDRKRQALIFGVGRSWLIGNRAVWIFHPLIWIGLILAYPKSRRIQAFFFWNKYVRSILGCWYVGPLITAVPFFRCRLFFPFKDSLLADAKLDLFDPKAYFPGSKVKLKSTDKIQLLENALPSVKGGVILEGESGLGKTMLLRRLVQQTKRVTVYLPAQKCEKGVIEAIQAKLHGQAQDPAFLQHLIYSGALDICIDGLNEVSPDVRANITAFVESYFKGNILMTTQPLQWNPPATAKTYVLQPLHRNQIQQFLLLQQPLLGDSHLSASEYESTCTTFLQTTLDEQQNPEELALAQKILSNPMDLSVAAQIIGQGLQPDLLQLQQQQYKLMARDYEQSWNQKFPLQQFSEYVYDMRVNDQYGMAGDAFYQALSVMEQERHRMVLSRQWQDPRCTEHKEWSFRHDKITEFFLVQSFLAPGEKELERRHLHLGDSRFRGIYLMLACLLPSNAALALKDDLVNYAADTKDHTVVDDYVKIVRSRQA